MPPSRQIGHASHSNFAHSSPEHAISASGPRNGSTALAHLVILCTFVGGQKEVEDYNIQASFSKQCQSPTGCIPWELAIYSAQLTRHSRTNGCKAPKNAVN